MRQYWSREFLPRHHIFSESNVSSSEGILHTYQYYVNRWDHKTSRDIIAMSPGKYFFYSFNNNPKNDTRAIEHNNLGATQFETNGTLPYDLYCGLPYVPGLGSLSSQNPNIHILDDQSESSPMID
jgi:hypothetical protein